MGVRPVAKDGSTRCFIIAITHGSEGHAFPMQPLHQVIFGQ